jgi:hypothetical protein
MRTCAEPSGTSRRGRRRALAALTVLALVLVTPAAWAQAEHPPGHTGPVATAVDLPVWLAAVLLVGSAVVAGAGLVRPFAGEPGPLALVAVRAATVLTVAALAMATIKGAANVLVVVVHCVVVVVASMLLSRRVGAFAGGLLLTAVLLVEVAFARPAGDPAELAVAAAYLLAGVAAVGVAIAVAGASRKARWALTRRLAPAAVAVAVGAGLVHVVAAPAQPERPRPGVPLLRDVQVDGQRLSVLLAPQRPGPNLVLVAGEHDGVRVGPNPGDLVGASPRPGAGGRWALVDLPAGAGELWVEHGGDRVPVDVDAGHGGTEMTASIAGPDGPECVDAALGAALAGTRGRLGSCPADALSTADEASLRALVGALAKRAVHTLTIAADGSARSTAAAAVVHDAAEHHALTVAADPADPGPDGALVVVSGWAAATSTLADVAGRQRAGVSYPAGTYLAPWLLAAPVLRAITGSVLPLRFDPRDAEPARYEVALGTRMPGHTPTASGYRGWLAGRGIDAQGGTRLYAASLVSAVPAEFAMRHGHGGWLPGGTVVPVSPPLSS